MSPRTKNAEAKPAAPKTTKPRKPRKKVVLETEAKIKTPQAKTEILEVKSKGPSLQYISTVGRRKTAVASLKLFTISGTGKIEINGKPLETVFPVEKLRKIILHPLEAANLKMDVAARVFGGGISAQAESLRLAIARALVKLNPDLRPILRAKGFLTCDSRNKERKKYGLKRARRAPQWQKR